MEENNNHDVVKLISTEAGGEGKPPIKGLVEEVTPNKYNIEIDVEDWEQNLSIFECEKEVPGIHESCICKVFPDDDMILNKASDRDVGNKLLKDIYDGEKLKVFTSNGKIKVQWIGGKPSEKIYFEIEELPFFDVPASKLGL